MRLAGKLTVSLILGILSVMALYAYLQIRQEVVLFEADVERVRRLGRLMLGMMEEIWRIDGEARLREIVAQADQGVPEVGFRIFSLDPEAHEQESPPLTADERATLSAGAIVVQHRSGPDGVPWRYTYAPVTVQGIRPVAVEVRESLQHQHAYIRMGHYGIIAATVGIVLVCGLIVSLLHYSLVGQPLRAVRDKARRAGSGDFSGPLQLPQDDEIGELAAELNGMCESLADTNRRLSAETEARISALEQLRHTDRLATVGQLAAGVAHELGTPLSVISARAQLIVANDLTRQDVAGSAHAIVDQADRMTEIIQQLLDFSRRRAAKPGLVSLQQVITRTLDLLIGQRTSKIKVDYDMPAAPLHAWVDQNQLQQALTNIVLNAIQAMPEGGRLDVRLGMQHAQPPAGAAAGDYLCIRIEDQGSGIAREHMNRIFEPFFTTKGVGEGTGLGLAVTHGIIAEHGGWISVDSDPGKGTRFSIFLPPPAQAHDLEAAS